MNEDQRWIERDLGITEVNHWFESAAKRAEFRARLLACANAHGCRIAFSEAEGWNTRLRTVARMTMCMEDGRSFDYEYDFGYAYDSDSAFYMWHEGNYSCDCNRSLFLGRAGHQVSEMKCGDTITLKNFSVTQEA